METDDRRPQVIYGNDPLCGWCFAIGPDLQEARRRLGDSVGWRIECGGLVTGERVRPVAEDRGYLERGLATVRAASGREAGPAYYDGILAEGTWVSDSEPVCRAVLVVRDLAGEAAIDFSHRLTDSLYLHGREPDAPETIAWAATQTGLDADAVVARWLRPEARALTREGFLGARRLGVAMYPSLLVSIDGVWTTVLAGYAPADEIVERVSHAVGLQAARP